MIINVSYHYIFAIKTSTTFSAADIAEFYFSFLKVIPLQTATPILEKENEQIPNFISYRIFKREIYNLPFTFSREMVVLIICLS